MTLKMRSITGFFFFLWMVPQALGATIFSDVSSDHPYYQAIQSLHEQGVIQGYSNNTFRPDFHVNRAEALKIILLGSKVFVPDIQPTEIFPDVLPGVWYDKYAAKAKNLGIVKGDDQTGRFRPGDTINLAEILKILLAANHVPAKAPTNAPYADVPLDAWFAPYFDYAKFVSLLEVGPEGKAEPSTPVTRGLMAELLHRLGQKPKAEDYGKASFYGDKFHGRTTASGDVFDASSFTAAHRTYPFGTWLQVTNAENGKSVLVRVNDRGPYTQDGRVIDLSQAAFESIASLSRGVIRVTLELASAPETPPPPLEAASQPSGSEAGVPEELVANLLSIRANSCPERQPLGSIPENAFESITLSEPLPTQIVADQVLGVRGQVNSDVDSVTAFFADSSGKQTASSAPVMDGHFSLLMIFPGRGDYQLGLIPGDQGKSVVHPLKVLPYECLQEKEKKSLAPPSGLLATLENGDGKIAWQYGPYNLFHLTFVQEGQFKRYLIEGADQFRPFYPDFKNFKEGDVTVYLRGTNLGNDDLLAKQVLEWSPPATMKIKAVKHEDYLVEKDQVTLERVPASIEAGRLFRMTVIPKTPLRETASLILPDGEVKDVMLTHEHRGSTLNQHGIRVFSVLDEPLTLSFRPTQLGLHMVEVNNAEGLAAVNIPLYPEGVFPLLPSYSDLNRRTAVDLGNDFSAIRQQFLILINRDRARYARPPLSLDTALFQLAQFRSDDMVKNGYFGHWDSGGRSANDLRGNFAIAQIVSENLAQDVNLESAEDGLMRSAIHRKNLLNPDWTRVGLGLSRHEDGTYTFVQLFSEDPLDLSNLPALRQEILATINKSRIHSLSLDESLNTLAQAWSDQMAAENFFAFEDPSGQSLFDLVKQAGIRARVGTYIVGNTSFGDALMQIEKNEAVKDIEWILLGVGIKQDKSGVFKITLLYRE